MKNKNTIIFCAIVILVVVGLVWYAKPSKNQNNETDIISSEFSSTLALKASETLYDFGTISMKNGNVSKIFKVTNTTNSDILFTSLTTSCMCTEAYFIQPDGIKKGPFGMSGMGFVPKLNETIKIGESRDIEVVYDPKAHGPAGVGIIDRFVYLEDSHGGKLQFEIKANVTP